jgi:hypothetical protein
MEAAIATLQTVARQIRLAGNLEPAKHRRIMAKLREVADELSDVERHAAIETPDPVDFAELLRSAGGLVVRAPESVMIAGPARDLRDLVSSLSEYALSVGHDELELRAQVKYMGCQSRAVCATELQIATPALPDFLQRKLWQTVHARRGEVSIVTKQDCCRVEFVLPIERRKGTILG